MRFHIIKQEYNSNSMFVEFDSVSLTSLTFDSVQEHFCFRFLSASASDPPVDSKTNFHFPVMLAVQTCIYNYNCNYNHNYNYHYHWQMLAVANRAPTISA